jgi:hypothetical protein
MRGGGRWKRPHSRQHNQLFTASVPWMLYNNYVVTTAVTQTLTENKWTSVRRVKEKGVANEYLWMKQKFKCCQLCQIWRKTMQKQWTECEVYFEIVNDVLSENPANAQIQEVEFTINQTPFKTRIRLSYLFSSSISDSLEVELMFFPWIILLKNLTGRPDLSISLCSYYM